MNRIIRMPLLAGLFLLATATTQGQLIQMYNFTNSAGNEANLPADGQPANGQLGTIKRGSGLSTAPGANTFAATNFTLGTAIDFDDYFEFDITANTGFFLNLDSVAVTERRSGTGIRKFAVRSSLDNYGSDLKTFSVPDETTNRPNQKVSLGTEFKDVAGGTPVRFRYYGYEAEGTGGTWRLDSIRIYGTISTSVAINSSITSMPGFSAYSDRNDGGLLLASQHPVPVLIYSELGVKMMEFKSLATEQKVDTRQWKPGIYFIRETTGGRVVRWLKN